jgi:hypothetical protein
VSHTVFAINRHFCELLISLGFIVAAGCGSGQSGGDAAPDTSHIKELTTLYVSYMNRNAGRPPASDAEFKKYVADNGGPLLESVGTSAEQLFVSPRDNEPYVILYGSEAAKLLRHGIVVHERSGVDGRRLVGYRGGFVNEVDEAEFRKLVPAA